MAPPSLQKKDIFLFVYVELIGPNTLEDLDCFELFSGCGELAKQCRASH